MKRTFFLLILVLLSIVTISQTPNLVKYQTVVRDANGSAMVSANVNFQISILESSTTGNSVYVETFSASTNAFGLVNLEIGNGTLVSGDFSTIDWASNLHFIKIEVDILDGNGLQNMGISQLLSVPYALNAKSAENVFSGDYVDLVNQPLIPANTSDLTNNSGFITSPDDADADTTNEIQTISKTGSIVTLSNSGGSFIDAVNDADTSSTNELQTISQTGNSLTLSNGGGTVSVADNDDNSTNELQTISKTGTTVTLSNSGGSFTDAVDDADASTTNELQTISQTGNSLTLSNGGGTVTVADNDDDSANEIQDLDLIGNTLTITNNASATNVDLSGYSNLWQETGNNIYYNNGYVGVGVNNPDGKLIIQGDASINADSAIFEVKNKDGRTVFAVYEEGVRIYVDDNGTKATSSKGGFAVGGFSAVKGLTNEYFRVTPDSIRAYIEASSNSSKGGFAVGGFSATKAFTHEYLRVTDDSTRVWTEDTDAGFGVRDIAGSSDVSYMQLSPRNYFIGENSGSNISTGFYNSTYGYETGKNLTTGSHNVFLGYKAGVEDTIGIRNTYIGYLSGEKSNGDYNVFLGSSAGSKNIDGNSNVFIGSSAGSQNLQGNDNVFMGYQAGSTADTSYYNVFIGSRAGYSCKKEGIKNVFIGFQAGHNNHEGQENVFIGTNAGELNTIGSNNIFIGTNSGSTNSFGSNNLFLGNNSGDNNTLGNNNLFLGNQSGYANASGFNNIFLGQEAGAQNLTGSFNSYIGYQTGFNSQTGESNTYVGYQAGYANQTGRHNTYIGRWSGVNNMIGSYNVFIGTEAGRHVVADSFKLHIDAVNSLTYQAPLIYGEFATTNRNVVIDGDNSLGKKFFVNGDAGGLSAWWNASDLRLKKEIITIENALDKVNNLRGVNYYWKDAEKYGGSKQMGFIAQETEEIIPEVVDKNNDHYSMQYAPITALLVEAVKELERKMNEKEDQHKQEIELLLKRIEELENK